MPGANLAGVPNTNDYNLGRGVVYFGLLDANGNVVEYRDVGNASKFEATVTTTTLQHKSSRAGLAVVDKQIVTDQQLELNIDIEEINFENLAFFFSGTKNTLATSAAAAIAGIVGVGNLSVTTKGRWYDFYQAVGGAPATNASGARVYDLGTLTTLKNTGNTVTYTPGTDYVFDAKMGRIFIPLTSTMTAGGVGTPTLYNAIFAANAGAKTPDEVRALVQTTQEVAIKFLAANPASSDQVTEYQFHKVSLAATGNFGLISDQITTMALKGAAEANSVADTNSNFCTIRTHANAHA